MVVFGEIEDVLVWVGLSKHQLAGLLIEKRIRLCFLLELAMEEEGGSSGECPSFADVVRKHSRLLRAGQQPL